MADHKIINFRETGKLIKEGCNCMEKQDMVGKMSEKNTSVLCRYMNCILEYEGAYGTL